MVIIISLVTHRNKGASPRERKPVLNFLNMFVDGQNLSLKVYTI